MHYQNKPKQQLYLIILLVCLRNGSWSAQPWGTWLACSSEWQNIHRKKDISEYCEVIWQGLTTSKCVLLADHTNGRLMLQCCVSLSVICNVAKWCVLPKIYLKKQIGNGQWGIEWSRDRWRHMPWEVNDISPICLRPSISKTAIDAIEQQSIITQSAAGWLF